MTTDNFWTISDMANYCKKSKKTIYRWVETGVIPRVIQYRLKRDIRVKPEEFINFIEGLRCK